MPGLFNPLRGEIWRVNFKPVAGAETGKARPAVVVGDERLGRLQVRIVVAVTGWNERYQQHPWMTELVPNAASGLSKPSAADALQIRTVSLLRFEARLGRLPAEVVDEIAGSIALCVRAPQR